VSSVLDFIIVMILLPITNLVVRILLFDVNTKYVLMVSKQIFEKHITTICQSTNCFAFIASAIIAAWRQIVLVIKRFVFICGVFWVLELTEFSTALIICHFLNHLYRIVTCSSFSWKHYASAPSITELATSFTSALVELNCNHCLHHLVATITGILAILLCEFLLN
jgi:hypothetical protein